MLEESLGADSAFPAWFQPHNDVSAESNRLPAVAVDLAARLVNGRRASLLLPSPREDGLLTLAAATGISRPIVDRVRVRLGEPVAGAVALDRQPLLVNQREVRPGHRDRGYLTGGFLSVPVPLAGGACGVLSVADARRPEGFQVEDLRALEALTTQVTTSLDHQLLRQRAYADERTIHQLRRQVIEVQEAERQRLARDLHDEAGHALTAAVLRLDLEIAKQVNDSAAITALNRAREQLVECAQTLHTIAFNLRPRILEDFGLHAALRSLARHISEQSDLRVEVEITGDVWTLAEMEELAILRVTQEALTNTQKHARASKVDIQLHYDARRLTLRIEDDGVGIAPRSAGSRAKRARVSMGIHGMRERIELLNGTFWIGPGPTGGTVVSVVLPR
ncbi:MAG TPA: GAF domain-containing sensor histidine kinase [Nitrolancea sp.]|nr:GAF domain-containing sensor histidine kinase [Nitrolancea sp.]